MPDTTKPSLLFMGTPELAKTILERLHKGGYPIAGVCAQPDKPSGRGKKMHSPPVALYAKENNLPLFQPPNARKPEVIAQIQNTKPDFIVVAAYGKILPQAILDAPKIDAINVHASLLPKYRGAAPINHAILNGDAKTGVSIMGMVYEMDAGPVYLTKETPIALEDNAITLTERLATLGAEAVIETLIGITEKDLKSQEQEHSRVTLAPKLSREMSPLDWTKDSQALFNQIRALVPWPVALTRLDGKNLKVYSSEQLNTESPEIPGTLVHIGKTGWTISTGGKDLLIKEVQFEGKKRMNAFDLANGLRLEAGSNVLGH